MGLLLKGAPRAFHQCYKDPSYLQFGFAGLFLLSQEESRAMKYLDNLGMHFAFAFGFLLVNYDNSFIIAKEIDF